MGFDAINLSIDLKMVKKINIKTLTIIIVVIILIGIAIPLIISFTDDDINVSFEIKAESRTSIQKALNLITIYQSFDVNDDGIIVANTHTLFNIIIQKQTFSNSGTTIDYFPF